MWSSLPLAIILAKSWKEILSFPLVLMLPLLQLVAGATITLARNPYAISQPVVPLQALVTKDCSWLTS
jgi:hypothetical protein